MDINPNDYTANESAVHQPETGPNPEDVLAIAAFLTEPGPEEGPDEDWSENAQPFDVDAIFPESNPADDIHALLVAQGAILAAQLRTAAATETLVVQFAEVVATINALAAKADGIFGDDGPKIPGPAGLMLSALFPKR